MVETRPLEANGEATVDAFCPRHDQVISGGYVQGASNGEVTRAVPIQQPSPGFEVAEFEQPGIGTGNQDTTVTAVADCVPANLGGKNARAVFSPTARSCQARGRVKAVVRTTPGARSRFARLREQGPPHGFLRPTPRSKRPRQIEPDRKPEVGPPR